MDMQAALKAGGVGAAVLFVLTLLGIIPCVGCVTWILGLAAYVGVGYLASYWMEPPRQTGTSAGTGAVAALIAGLVAGIINMVIMGIQTAISGSSTVMDPETMAQLSELGIDPEVFTGVAAGIGGALIVGSICCLISMAISAGLGAAGGAIHASTKPND